MSFASKVQKGLVPTEKDWELFLKSEHARAPHMTPEAFAAFKTESGLNSYEVLLQDLTDSSDDRVILDLACGDGHMIPAILSKLMSGSSVIAFDLSEHGLEIARSRLQDPRVKFVQGRAQDMPFEDETFDHIFCHMSFMLMSPIEDVVREIKRVLKPKGKFSAVIPGGEVGGFLEKLCKLTALFVQTHIPSFTEVRKLGSALSTVEDWQRLFIVSEVSAKDIRLHYHVTPEGVWDYLHSMYFTLSLPEAAKREFKDEVLTLAKDHRDQTGKVSFFVPLRRYTVLLE